MSEIAWLFTCFWSDRSLRRSFELVANVGGLAEQCARRGRASSSAWFHAAADLYSDEADEDYATYALAYRTCAAVAFSFEDGSPA